VGDFTPEFALETGNQGMNAKKAPREGAMFSDNQDGFYRQSGW
jgi:hypothetical protein